MSKSDDDYLSSNACKNAFPMEGPFELGLSKREYIATAVLSGMLAIENPSLKHCVKLAVDAADALLEELKRRP